MDYQELIALVAKAKKGDKEAFEAICHEKAKDVLYICIHYMGNRQDGEDAAQEVFIEMQKSIKKLKTPQTFTAWSNKLITRVCLRLLRKRARRMPLSINDLGIDVADELQAEFLAEDFVEQAEKRQLVINAMQSLSFKNRQMLVLFYYEGLSIKQLAQTLDISEDAAKMGLYRARISLKKQIGKRAGQELEGEYGENKKLGGVFVLTRILRLDADTTIEEAARRVIGGIGLTITAGSAAPMVAKLAQTAATSFLAWAAVGTAAVATAVAVTAGTYTPPAPNNALPLLSATSAAGGVPQHSVAAGAGSNVEGYIQPAVSTSQALQRAVEQDTPALQPPGSNTASAPERAEHPEHKGAPSSSPSEVMFPGAAPGAQPALPEASETSALERPESPESGKQKEPSTAIMSIIGSFAFVDGEEAPHPAYNKMAEGFGVLVYSAAGKLLATTQADENGAFTLTLAYPPQTILVDVSANSGFAVVGSTAYPLQINGESAHLPAIRFTDTLAPAGAVYFLDAAGRQTEDEVNPRGAEIQVFDSTEVAITWSVRDAGTGTAVAEGVGGRVDFTGLPQAEGLVKYSLLFTLADIAGNTAEVECGFVMLTDK